MRLNVAWARCILEIEKKEVHKLELESEMARLDNESEEFKTKSDELDTLEAELVVMKDQQAAFERRAKTFDNNQVVNNEHASPIKKIEFEQSALMDEIDKFKNEFSPVENLGMSSSFSGHPKVKPQKPSKFLKGQNFTRFARRFAEHVELCGLEDAKLHLYLLSFVDCDSTYEKLSRVKLSRKESSNIRSIIKRYTEEIYPPSELQTIRAELLSIKQQHRESMTEFLFRIDEVASKAAFESESVKSALALQALVAGVRSDKIKEELLKRSSSDYEQAARTAVHMEKVVAALELPDMAEENLEMPVFKVGQARPQFTPTGAKPQPHGATYNMPNITEQHRNSYQSREYPSRAVFEQYNSQQPRGAGQYNSTAQGNGGQYSTNQYVPYQYSASHQPPPRQDQYQYSNRRVNENILCYSCHRYENHIARNCPYRDNRYTNRGNDYRATRS